MGVGLGKKEGVDSSVKLGAEPLAFILARTSVSEGPFDFSEIKTVAHYLAFVKESSQHDPRTPETLIGEFLPRVIKINGTIIVKKEFKVPLEANTAMRLRNAFAAVRQNLTVIGKLMDSEISQRDLQELTELRERFNYAAQVLRTVADFDLP